MQPTNPPAPRWRLVDLVILLDDVGDHAYDLTTSSHRQRLVDDLNREHREHAKPAAEVTP